MKVVFIVGPTASGKSQLAIELCRLNKSVIINSDSQQFYQQLEIGSASPSLEDKQKVPHYLFQVIPPPSKATAGWFYREVMQLLREFEQKKMTHVFIVGGTGFYLQALEDGLLPVGPGQPELRAELEARAAGGELPTMYNELVAMDPITGAKIKAPDAYRIIRALEIIKVAGRPLSLIQKEWAESKPPFPYPIIKIGVTGEKEQLQQRVCKRTQAMLAQGVIQEVINIRNQGFIDWDALNSVGYFETKKFVTGEIASEKELELEIIKSTMKLIKKQKTWFKRDSHIHWVSTSNTQEDLEQKISYIQRLL